MLGNVPKPGEKMYFAMVRTNTAVITSYSIHYTKLYEFSLVNGETKIAPSAAKNVKELEGVDGKGVYIPKDGLLTYPSKDLFNPEKGTVSLWLKLDNTPSGMFAFRDRDRLENGDWGD